MTKYTVLKGLQLCFPRPKRSLVPYVNKTRYKWTIKFTEESTYDLRNAQYPEDQYDWNKTCGVTWSFLDNKVHTFMVAHRWNIEEGIMEISPYIHNNSSKEFVGGGGSYYESEDSNLPGLPMQLIKAIPLNREFVVEMILSNDKTMLIKIDGGLWYWYSRPMKGAGLFSKQIAPYFGGSSEAPSTVSWYVDSE